MRRSPVARSVRWRKAFRCSGARRRRCSRRRARSTRPAGRSPCSPMRSDLDRAGAPGAKFSRCGAISRNTSCPTAAARPRSRSRRPGSRWSPHHRTARRLDHLALAQRPRLARRDSRAPALEHLDALVDALVLPRAHRRPHRGARTALRDAARRPARRCAQILRAVEAHRDREAPLRPVDGVQRRADLRQVVRAGAHDELVVLPGQRAAGFEQRPQDRNHLLGGAMPQRNHFERALREAPGDATTASSRRPEARRIRVSGCSPCAVRTRLPELWSAIYCIYIIFLVHRMRQRSARRLCAVLSRRAPPPRAERSEALLQALLALGVDYRYGGKSPVTGFDCSGLVAHVYQEAWGIRLPPNDRGAEPGGRAGESSGTAGGRSRVLRHAEAPVLARRHLPRRRQVRARAEDRRAGARSNR